MTPVLNSSAAREKRSRAAFALVPYAVLMVLAYTVFCVTPDDPYITYRYAANLLVGHGPVFNIGERVEGFSSPLHLLLCAALLRVAPSVDILFKAKLLGLTFAVFAVWQTGLLARTLRFSPSYALLAQMLTAANIMFAQAAVNGLETSLYALLLLLSLRAFVQEIAVQDARGRGIRSALWLFLTLLARPETALVFALLLPLRVAWNRRDGRSQQDTAAWAALFLLPLLALVGARLWYYGEPVPNTYFAKNMPVLTGLASGWRYLWQPVSLTPVEWGNLAWLRHPKQLIAVLGMLLFWGLAGWGLLQNRLSRPFWVLGAAVLAQTVFVLRAGGDWMPGWRFLAPLIPALAILQCGGLRALAAVLPRAGRAAWTTAAAAAVLVWGLCAISSPHAPWAQAGFSTHGDVLMASDTALGRKWVATAHFLQRLPPGVSVADSELGLAGYLNLDKTFLDTRGLTDRAVARLPRAVKYPWGVDDPRWTVPGDPLHAILARRRPDVIVAFTRAPLMPRRVLGDYELTDSISDPRDPPAAILPALVYRRLPLPPKKASHASKPTDTL